MIEYWKQYVKWEDSLPDRFDEAETDRDYSLEHRLLEATPEEVSQLATEIGVHNG